jgi:MFS superfamily sulfate permease-like transporter
LSGHADAVGVELRRFIKGTTRNDLPFLFSMGVMRQSDDHFAVEILECDKAACPDVHANRKQIEQEADRYWRDACLFLSANDLTNAITGLVKASHGFLLRDEGVIWYMPADMIEAYDKVASVLQQHGVVMQTVRFNPIVNDDLVKHVCGELERRSLAVFNGQIEEADDMHQRGAKPRKNGQQTRLEQWIAAEETMQHNKSLLGKAFARVAKAAQAAREKIGAEALKAFAG